MHVQFDRYIFKHGNIKHFLKSVKIQMMSWVSLYVTRKIDNKIIYLQIVVVVSTYLGGRPIQTLIFGEYLVVLQYAFHLYSNSSLARPVRFTPET